MKIILISIAVIYLMVFSVMMLRAGFSKRRLKVPNKKITQYPTISVVIPFRDELANMSRLIEAIDRQQYNKEKFEVLLIDDHSTDGGTEWVAQKIKSGLHSSFRLIKLVDRSGKKAAIGTGVEEAKNELIVQTDADCLMGPAWLTSIAELYAKKSPSLILGIVEISSKGFSFLQKTEFKALMALTYHSTENKIPILANGANIAYSKHFYEAAKQLRKDSHVSSGDDMFLLHAAKKVDNGKILFNTDPLATVKTNAISDFFKLIDQRVRWAQKTKYFSDMHTQLIGVLIIAVNLILLFSILLFALAKLSITDVLLIFFIKWITDFLLIWSCRSWLSIKNLFLGSLVLSVIYPFYSISIALLSLLYRPKWKGRKINSL